MSERFKTKKIKCIPIEVEDIADDGSIISTKYNIYVRSFSTEAIDKILPCIGEYVATLFKSQILRDDAIDNAQRAKDEGEKIKVAQIFGKDFSDIINNYIIKRSEEQPKLIKELFLILTVIIPEGLGKDGAIPKEQMEEFIIENISPEYQLEIVKESLNLFDISRYAENFTKFQEQTTKLVNPQNIVTPGIGQTQ